MRLSRSAMAVTAGSVMLLGALGGSAGASGSLSKTDLLPQGETITVNYSNLTIPAGNSNIVIIQQCRKDDAGPFNQILDCSQYNSINPAYPGTGSATIDVFGGDEPALTEWGCGPNTTPGLPAASTCYIRLAPGNANNTAGDEFFPITFTGTAPTTTEAPTTTVDPGTNVPEVPMNVLLPLGAAAVIGGTVVVSRRRTAKSA